MAYHRGNTTRCRPIHPDHLLEAVSSALRGGSAEGGISTPSSSGNEDVFRDEYLIREFLRKYPREGDKGVTRATALKTMFEREGKNAEANSRIARRDYGDDPRVRLVYHQACRKAIIALGRFDSSMFRESLRHGPGSTVRLKSSESSVEYKLAGKPTVTAKALALGYLVLTEAPLWVFNINREISPESVLVIEDNEKVTTVPKNAETDRVIAIQPDLNIYCQLAVGACIRHSLERVGVNLNDQTINQRRACDGSITGNLATVDLSSASDSITTQLVWDFIGNWSDLDGRIDRTWWRVMETLRCETGMVDGKTFTWERFSAMGNGYTFELESLIFWALTVATCEVLGITPDVTVYGDDIICPVEALPLLQMVFAFCGFDFNEKKTHKDSPPTAFRESCGKHYYNGVDVSPFYVDKPLDNDAELLLLANNIVRWAAVPFFGWGRDKRLEPVWHWVVSHLSPAARKSCIPYGSDDDGLILDFDEAKPTVKRESGPLQFVRYRDTGCWFLDDSSGQLTSLVETHILKVHAKPMRIGYACRTWKCVNEGRPLSDDEAYLVWHYQKSFRKYLPPGGADGDPGWLKAIRVEPYTRYKASSPKTRYKEGRRYVESWSNVGPWL